MMKNVILRPSLALASVLSLTVLAGCGGTTYGTGVSQESQLASDVGGMMLLGTGEKKEPINYASRSKLVKAPTPGQLPSPAERVTSDSAYFPINPEEARAKRLAALDESGDRSGSHAVGASKTLRVSGTGPVDKKQYKKFHNGDQEESAAEMLRASRRGHKERLARLKEVRSLGGGATPRKYLTQPPVEYRTPAETAPAGTPGEYEKTVAEKKRKPIFGSWGN